jgi:hypothetical protein
MHLTEEHAIGNNTKSFITYFDTQKNVQMHRADGSL